jgi:hypothetical protein
MGDGVVFREKPYYNIASHIQAIHQNSFVVMFEPYCMITVLVSSLRIA